MIRELSVYQKSKIPKFWNWFRTVDSMLSTKSQFGIYHSNGLSIGVINHIIDTNLHITGNIAYPINYTIISCFSMA